MITSLRNPRVQEARAGCARCAQPPQRCGAILIVDGASELRRAIAAGIAIEVLFYCPELCQDNVLSPLLQSLMSGRSQGPRTWNCWK